MRVLIVNYDFPPALSGVRRVVKFAKYLPEFGLEPIILCAHPTKHAPVDMEALEEVEAAGYRVVRTGSFDPHYILGGLKPGKGPAPSVSSPAPELSVPDPAHPGRRVFYESRFEPRRGGSAGKISRAMGSLFRQALVPDDRIGWLPFAKAAAGRILRAEPIPFVVTSSYPNTSHLVGLYLKRHFKVKWVADFRDGWTQNPYFSRGLTPVHSAWNRRLEAKVAREADALITVSDPIAEHLRTLTDPDKVYVISNGYDLDDYESIEPLEFEKFTLAYTGTLFLQRSPMAFFQALRMLFDEHPTLPDYFQVIFRTRFQPEHEHLIQELNLTGVIQNWGLGTHREALQLQISAHALLALESDGPNSEIMLTQKVFEYLAAAKPILAIAPPHGALAEMVRRSGSGTVVSPDRLEWIKERLFELFHDQVPFQPDSELISRFDRRELTRDLAALLWKLKSQNDD